MYWWVLIVLIICYRFFKVELYDIWVVVYVMINWFNIWDHTYKELVIMRPVFLQENQRSWGQSAGVDSGHQGASDTVEV